MLDCTLFGLNAGASHIINVGFHAANTILLFIVFGRLTKSEWQSAFIAGLFALHPLHVESVAWIAERRDMLSTLFWLLTMLFYARYAERPSVGRYLAAITMFILGLLSKPMLVTLPFVLLLLDYWPLGRFGDARYRLSRLLLEKVPFIILSAIASAVTFLTSQKVGAIVNISHLPLNERIINAIVSYLTYIGKMIWPTDMAVLYPHPGGTTPVSKAVIYGSILIMITIFVVCYCRRYKYLFVGWLWYLGTLVPVIGIVQVGSQAIADRYTYIPLIGLFVIIAFGATELLEERPSGKIVLGVLAGISLSACAVVTSHQLNYWKDSLSLFGHALAVTKDNYLMHTNYAIALNECGRQDEAAAHFAEAVRLMPGLPDTHDDYGNILRKMGKIDQAIEQYKITLKIDPNFMPARYNLGLALAVKGDYEGAIEQYRLYSGKAVDEIDIRRDMAIQLAKEGRPDDAVSQFQKALIAKPDSTEVLSKLGYALAQSGKPQEAIEYYNKALAIDSNDVITHGRLALALASLSRFDEAIEQCRIVVATRPDDFEMRTNLGMLLQKQDKLDEAIECYKKALQINPNFQKARDNLDALTEQKKGS